MPAAPWQLVCISSYATSAMKSFTVPEQTQGSRGLDYKLVSRAHFQAQLFCYTLVTHSNIFVWSILPTLILVKGFITLEPIPVYARWTEGGKKMGRSSKQLLANMCLSGENKYCRSDADISVLFSVIAILLHN